MKIQKLYEATCSESNNWINKVHYKINKAIVNYLYPLLSKTEYGLDESHNVIVSLTSYPARIGTVHLTVKTLLNQTYKPKQIVLWLSTDQFPNGMDDLPQTLTGLRKYGLSIRFCENIYPHKKYYYTMLENPEASVITVDDDVFYPENLVERLVQTSERFPNTVCCYWAHRFELGEDDSVFSYAKWELETKGFEPSDLIIPTGVGGVLYPPHSLNKEVFDLDAIREDALRTDDLWLKVMGLLNNTKAVRISLPARIPFSVVQTQKTGLYYENVKNNNNSSESWNKLMVRYPYCKDKLISEYKKEKAYE